MKSIFKAIKDVFDGNRDKRMKNIKRAMRSLGYNYNDRGEFIECNFGVTNKLPYKSEVFLRPDDENGEPIIVLGFTIYGKRTNHDVPFQSPEAKEAIKDYKFTSYPDSLLLYIDLKGDGMKKNEIAEAVKKIRDTGIAVYTYAGIPEDPVEAITIGDIPGPAIKVVKDFFMKEHNWFEDISVSEEGIHAQKKDALMEYGFSFTPNDSRGYTLYVYFRNFMLPLSEEKSKKLMETFVSELESSLSYVPKCTNSELSITANISDKAEFIAHFLKCVCCIGNAHGEVQGALLLECARQEAERRKQEEEERRRREEEARRKALAESFTLTLRGGVTVRQIQEYFTEEYPYLRIGFYLQKTSQQADRDGGTIINIASESTLNQIRTFRGDGQVTIAGSSTPESIEKEFRSNTGLVVKLGYNDENDKRYYIAKGSSYYYKTCIYDLNNMFRDEGFNKADIS